MVVRERSLGDTQVEVWRGSYGKSQGIGARIFQAVGKTRTRLVEVGKSLELRERAGRRKKGGGGGGQAKQWPECEKHY